MQNVNNDHYFGPIKNGLPTAKPFTICTWQRVPHFIGQYMYTASYSIKSHANHYLFGFKIVDATNYKLISYVNNVGNGYRYDLDFFSAAPKSLKKSQLFFITHNPRLKAD